MTEQDHGQGHHRNYVKIWGILLVLLIISVFGPFLGHPIITLITAFGVAIVKAYLVAKNFMHLDVEKPIVLYVLISSFLAIVLLFAGISPDVMNHEGQNWSNDAAKQAVEQGEHQAGGGHK